MSNPAPASYSDDMVAELRRFNRFYTKRIGALDEGHLRSPFSLAEVRVLYEIANGQGASAAGIGKELGFDAGYMSRLLAGLQRQGLVQKAPSASDKRRRELQLTALGKSLFAKLDRLATDDVRRLLEPLKESDRRRLAAALGTARTILDPAARAAAGADAVTLRPPRPGDHGWVVERHGAIYAREYGWDDQFEALVAGVVASYLKNHDPRRDRCWIAERNGERVGSVYVVQHPQRDRVAKLRLLLVEPEARGLGIGRRLVEECVRFATDVGYTTMTLWTNDVLTTARRIYERAGFRLVAEEEHQHFGPPLVGQTWELELGSR